jgi:hypothetical protein
LVRFDGRDESIRIIGPLLVYLEVDDDLVCRFLRFHHPAELVRLARFALANHLRVCLLPSARFSPAKIGIESESWFVGLLAAIVAALCRSLSARH